MIEGGSAVGWYGEGITRSPADDYATTLRGDAERVVRLVWCSNRAASGKYDVWTMRAG